MKIKILESKDDQQKLIDFAGEDLANKFLKYRNKLKPPYNDLYFWINKPLNDFKTLIYRLDKSEGLINKTDKWKVYKITSPDMLNNLLGRHILWCIQDESWWDLHHNKKGTNYYLFITNNEKYIMGINKNNEFENGIWDSDNLRVHNKQIVNELNELLKNNI